MNEKNTKATETVEIDPGMSVMPEGPGPMDVPTVIPELDSMLAAMPPALPAYQTTVWKNKPSTETPVDAAVMTRVEQRLVDLTNAVNALRDSVSRIGASKIQNILFRESMNNSEDVIFDVTMSDGTVTTLGFSSNKFTYTNEKKSLKGGVALS
ncbi:MAG: hypothetical protein ACLT5H_01945 [Collinsella stercoris]|uniref:hypothetical protein n=1 Tax=Collinsella stercoris TaxID=147206 RepID=UPI003992470A